MEITDPDDAKIRISGNALREGYYAFIPTIYYLGIAEALNGYIFSKSASITAAPVLKNGIYGVLIMTVEKEGQPEGCP